MNINELLNSAAGQQIVANISQRFGLDQNQAVNAVQSAIPMILGGLGRNAQDENGAAALNSALSQHDPATLDNIQGFFGNSEAAQLDGSKILGHIFGEKVSNVENGVAQSSGISLAKIGPIVAMLAPLVMSYLNKQKQNNNVNQPGGLGDLIGGLAGGNSANGGGLIGMVSGFLDKNKDGSIMDDLLGMFGKK
jgi:hypothetical protein